MKSNYKKLPSSVIELEVNLDQKEFEPYWQSVYEKALSEVEIKGFRKGTAPKELADQVINKDKVFEEAAKNAIRFSLDEISKENNWTIIDRPVIEILESDPTASGGLKYKANLVIFPEIKLGDYKKIAKKVLKEKREVKVEPQEIEKSLQWLLNSRAKISLVDREAELNDLIDVDIEGFSDGKLIPGSKIKNDRFILGQGHFLPGFEKEILGHKAGENLNFSLVVPVDYWQEDLRNKKIDFKVKINAVFKREVPELNDEFSKGLGPNFQTVQDLKKSINEGLLIEKENKERERLRIQIIDELIKSSEIDIPEIMIQKTAEKMETDLMPFLASSGKSQEEIKSLLRERAKNNVAANLVIYKIAEIENLKPTPEEINIHQAQFQPSYHNHDEHYRGAGHPDHTESIDKEKIYDYSYEIVQNKKVFEFLEAQ